MLRMIDIFSGIGRFSLNEVTPALDRPGGRGGVAGASLQKSPAPEPSGMLW
jgi:hypothetical protein